ncbi:zyxin [Orussus abietinus]|uniref:zyxin n=1 Tax=Orussus abietinus TaxID=222816 RepID=UPI000626E4E6|nr:zyxin [Orussus abietinus]
MRPSLGSLLVPALVLICCNFLKNCCKAGSINCLPEIITYGNPHPGVQHLPYEVQMPLVPFKPAAPDGSLGDFSYCVQDAPSAPVNFGSQYSVQVQTPLTALPLPKPDPLVGRDYGVQVQRPISRTPGIPGFRMFDVGVQTSIPRLAPAKPFAIDYSVKVQPGVAEPLLPPGGCHLPFDVQTPLSYLPPPPPPLLPGLSPVIDRFLIPADSVPPPAPRERVVPFCY